MKRFKQADLLIQAGLLFGALISMFTLQLYELAFLLFYFSLGGWQLLSFFIHLIFRHSSWYAASQRMGYGIVLGVLAGLGLAGYIFWPLLLGFLALGLLIFSPLMALWYFMTCLDELKRLNARDYVHLKN